VSMHIGALLENLRIRMEEEGEDCQA